MPFTVTAIATAEDNLYAQKNFALKTELYLSITATFTNASITYVATDWTSVFAWLVDGNTSWQDGPELEWDGANVVWDTWAGVTPATGPVVGSTEYVAELHVVKTGAFTYDSELRVDGVTIGTSTGLSLSGGGWQGVVVGWRGGGDALEGTFSDLRVGSTTWGSSDVFADDFSAGSFAAYDEIGVTTGNSFTFGGSADISVEVTTGIAIAFDDTPLEPDPTWTRIDDPDAINVVQRWSIDRGRTSELEKTGTGTATIELIDTTGMFDPTNATSSLTGKLNPMKQVSINLKNPVTDAWSCLFRGFIADWEFEYVDEREKYLRVTLECVDAFDLFASLEMTPGHAGNTVPTSSSGDIYFDDDATLDAVQTRIEKALDDAGWDAALREDFTGNVGLQGTVYARNDGLLSVIQDAADAEFPGGVANAFMRKDGYHVFHGRFAKFNPTDPTYDITTWKTGDLAAFGLDSDTAVISKPYQFSRSRDKIINRALSLPQGVDEADVPGQIVSDATSITNYGVRSVSFDNLLTRNGDGPTTAVQETKLFGTYYVDNYADPRTRVDRLTFRPQPPDSVYGPAIWALMCGVDISDRAHLKTTHTGGGGFNEYFFVEGVHYTAEPMSDEQHEVTLTLDLSPAAYFDTSPF